VKSKAMLRLSFVIISAWLACSAGDLFDGPLSVRLIAALDPCGVGSNPIVCENSKPGNPPSQWDLPGSYPQYGDLTIQGFATDISVNKGGVVNFKIKTNATAYRLDIYRLGYYAGNGARLVATVQPSVALPQPQPSCAVDQTTHLVDCGNWFESASWAVPSNATSGVYIAKVIRLDTGGSNHIVFIVRDDDSHSEALFQTSDTTWQAYNRYGGYSLYYPSNSRAKKVSYNRPFITRDCCDESFFFSGEYPMLRWLEANGYDVSYTTGVDTDRRGEELLEHRLFLSVGHDEYWSGGQRANVEAARAAGVNLAFFSGNDVYWKTRWEPSIDGTNSAYRTLVSYKETYDNAKTDPSPLWTGTWRDPRFSPPSDGGRPENALTGTIFTVNCCTTESEQKYSITVPATYANLRIWRNTSIATLTPGQVATFPQGTLGYEWNEDVDNGARPPGLMRLSETTKQVPAHLIDYGNTFVPGTATHYLTLYRAASGALVFSSGTIRWAWGLDSKHDSASSTVDIRMQQATANLLADMGLQAKTLQPGLVPADPSFDTVAPTSTIGAPATGATFVAETAVTVSGTASDFNGVVAAVEVSVDGGATWHPAVGKESWTYSWAPAASGQVTIQSRAIDDSANSEVPGPGVTVMVTPRECPCTIWRDTVRPQVSTTGDTAAQELGVKFQSEFDGTITGIRFYKDTANTGTHVGHLWTNSGTVLASATFTNETASGWQQVVFTSPVPVVAGQTYVASYFAPNGQYSITSMYFASSGVDRQPLHALANGIDGPNGVYRFGSSGFPTSTYQSTNYFVDVVFEGHAPTPPSAPSNLTATAVASSRIDLTWTDVVGENGFRVERSTDNGVSWIVVGSTPQNITTFSNTGLTPSTTYTYRIVAFNGGGDSAPSPTATTRTPVPGPVPDTPSGLLGTVVSSTRIDLTWSDVAGETAYSVERSTSGGANWMVVATLSQNATAYTAAGLLPSTTYAFRVIASNGEGASPPSSPASATTAAQGPCPCTIWPTGMPTVQSSGDTTANELGVKFRADEDGYIRGIRFFKSPGNTGTHIGHLWTSGGALLGTATFANEGLSGWQEVDFASPIGITAGQTYVVSYFAPAGNYSNDVSYFATTGVDQPPLHALVNGADGANGVYRFGSSGFPAVSSQAANYWVDPVFVGSTTQQVPPQPTGLTATAVSSTAINLTWIDVTGETSYRLERSPDGGVTWPTAVTLGSNTTSFADSGLTPSTTYTYRIFASNSAGDSPASSTTNAITAPPTPPGLTATVSGSTRINLTWTDVTGETSYRVERSENSGVTWTVAGTNIADATSFSDVGLTASTTYSYRVFATNSGGDSAPATVTATMPPPPPATITATVVSSTRVDLTWADVTGETGYRIDRSTNGGTTWTSIATRAQNVVTYSDTTVQPLTTYLYQVVATSAAGASAPSPTASATTPADTTAPTTPGTLTASPGKKKVALRWGASTDQGGSGLVGYEIWRSTTGTAGTFVKIATAGATTTTYNDTGLLIGQTYWYYVVAIDGAGNKSTSSNTASATAI
jgi:fibronectin type 3 domain-containing protein